MHIGVRTFVPDSDPRALLFCLPGGSCNADYFDLDVPEDKSYSFARTMVSKGYLVVLADHLGLGQSYIPADGYELTLPRIVDANAQAFEKIVAQYPGLTRIFVGHSMGALLGLFQQAKYRCFDAMVLLGFGHGGVPDFLCPLGQELAKHPETAVEQGVELAKQQFGVGYFDMPIDFEKRYGDSPALLAALKKKHSMLLTVPASLSLVPGLAWSTSRKVAVPVFSAIGDKDMVGAFELQSDLVQGPVKSVLLPETGHNHFLCDGRHLLYTELEKWLNATLAK